MNSAQIDAYLRRIGVKHPAWPTVDMLRELHLRHLQTVPFENLSIHLGEELVLEQKRLVDKVVGRRRGGICYELNGAFGALLKALGFDVTLLAARVYGDERRLGVPYDHMALRVRTVDGGDWLADVGFGAHSHYPLAFGERGEQRDPAGGFRVIEAGADEAGVRGGGGERADDLDVLWDDKPQYRLELRPRVLGDFTIGAWWNTTSPGSHFVRSLVCSRVTEDGGRITLSGSRLTVTSPEGKKEVTSLADDAEVLELYRERFGIELDRVPTVRGAEPGGR
ncbi:arylamine N-acetyltransferase family protein [Streptomyces chiangmaiensis]|uniref:Arylamine N-acetyltransferase n=1 Tax=Streptomyces chiangmaiensis TaxID=766497 RepID=A0ABU7FJ63_9ACTN|nr:arylamine N-acetyltransferase [Streptomyces chiangmaiensis]MED7824156.1 arylamine N-acetyltransferase [Streptomyces chiangmaiensis]